MPLSSLYYLDFYGLMPYDLYGWQGYKKKGGFVEQLPEYRMTLDGAKQLMPKHCKIKDILLIVNKKISYNLTFLNIKIYGNKCKE